MNRPLAIRLSLVAAMVGLGAWSIELSLLSAGFAHEQDSTSEQVTAFVLLQVAAGLLYLATLWCLRSAASSRVLVLAVVFTGLLMRGSQITATPILEDDYFRYLWDGAVTAHAGNPYAYSPDEVRPRIDGMSDPVQRLAEQSRPVLDRINHPSLRTIYPPTAQAAFAAAHWISPFDLAGLRWTWLGLDVAIAAMLLLLLRGSPAPGFRFAIYWLNPLLIKEVFNAGHMELILVAAAVGALLAAARYRVGVSAFLLGLAAGAKVWPVLWLPLILRAAARRRRGMALGIGVFAGTVTMLALPIVISGLDSSSGFTAYAQRWQMNDSAYVLIHETFKLVSAPHAHLAARIAVGLVLLVVLVMLLRRSRPTGAWLVNSALVVTTTLFMLSPTQFPWYYLWLLPLLVLRPMWSLIGLTVTLPIYYLRFSMDAAGHAAWFDYGLVWIEFAPIWLLLALELRRLTRLSAIGRRPESCSCSPVNA